jgi:hypothetical protein
MLPVTGTYTRNLLRFGHDTPPSGKDHSMLSGMEDHRTSKSQAVHLYLTETEAKVHEIGETAAFCSQTIRDAVL